MNLFKELFDHYSEFHVAEVNTNRFSVEKFHQVLDRLTIDFESRLVGRSVEGRPIKLITLGNGPIKVLLWSQMHGNESTATRAILDLLHFFAQPGRFKDLSKKKLAQLTISIVPMLNPDGSNVFQRRNALEIDLNRDARSFTAPESKILKSVVEQLKPQFAFNLHDQRRFYNILGTGSPSTISFLAPAYDSSEGTNKSRGEAMKLIADLRNSLETVIPDQVGIYNDTYSPRAFGDYVQGTGASTILVESGWQHGDMEKEEVRKLNFCLLVFSFYSIAENKQANFEIEDYWQIPKNDEKLFDVLIKNVILNSSGANYLVDIGISRSENSVNETSYYSVGQIDDIGDLDGWYGFHELEEDDLQVHPGLVWPEELSDISAMSREEGIELLSEGYLYVKMEQRNALNYVNLPVNIVKKNFNSDPIPRFEGKANFLLKTSDGVLKYTVINGFLCKVGDSVPEYINGLVI
jgi:zinc carboxypeptidase